MEHLLHPFFFMGLPATIARYLRTKAATALRNDGFAGNVGGQIACEEHCNATDVGFRIAETS